MSLDFETLSCFLEQQLLQNGWSDTTTFKNSARGDLIVYRTLTKATLDEELVPLAVSGTAEAPSRVPGPWKRSLRALRAADGEAAPAALRGLAAATGAEDLEACRVIARALTCICQLPQIDPAAAVPGLSPAVWRLLDPSAVYAMPPAGLAKLALQLDEGAEPQAEPKHSTPPHVLSLALAVHAALLRHQALPPPSQLLWKGVAKHLDVQLFGEAPLGPLQKDRFPLSLFHPLLVPRQVVDLFLVRSSKLSFQPGSKDVYLRMIRVLRLVQQSEQPADASAVAYPADVFGAGTEALTTAFAAVERLRDMLHAEWPVRMLVKAKRSPSELSSQEAGDAEQLDEHDRRIGRELATCLASAPAVPVPPGFSEVYARQLTAVPWRKSDNDVLGVVSIAARDVALCPARWETWVTAATAFKHLFFHQDEENAQEDWQEVLQAFLQRRTSAVVWSGRLRSLHSHARVLNLMLWSYFEEELCTELGALVAEGATWAPRCAAQLARCQHLAQQWLFRQLDLIVLFRCRRKCLSQALCSSSRQDTQNIASKQLVFLSLSFFFFCFFLFSLSLLLFIFFSLLSLFFSFFFSFPLFF